MNSQFKSKINYEKMPKPLRPEKSEVDIYKTMFLSQQTSEKRYFYILLVVYNFSVNIEESIKLDLKNNLSFSHNHSLQ